MNHKLTQLTLTVDMGSYWIATTSDNEQCFVHASEVNNYPDCQEFSAIIVPNNRDHPKWYAKRISDELEITAPVGLIEGFDARFDMAYAAGLCCKIVFLDQNGDNKYFYAPDLASVYVEEFE